MGRTFLLSLMILGFGACGSQSPKTESQSGRPPYNDSEKVFQAVQQRGFKAVLDEPNLSDYDPHDKLDEVAVIYETHSGQHGLARVYGTVPGELAGLGLGSCPEMKEYALGVYIGRDQVAKIPPSGGMTPSLASVYHPQDQDPCSDYWSLEAMVVKGR